ncbi:MAG: HAD family hydrolase [Opitutaceae bacterium]
MKKRPDVIKTLLVDIGGVLLTNGWDHHSRQAAAKTFHLDGEEMEGRHRMNFDTFEVGKLTLEEYLDRVVFDRPRKFTRAQFRRFMFAQSQPFPEMLGLVRGLKARYGLKVIVVSNEGRELNVHRIKTFKLAGFVDAFVSSCFVHLRKPDADIFRLALDIAQTPVEQIVYLENTAMFIQVAEDLGIRGLSHTDYQSTRAKLAALGLECADCGKEHS